MGESMVEAPNTQSKMGESVKSDSSLEVSISFGRFENDSLSWEKWSTFSPNKYLEEVEKCSTPGSVAQKKAYFEAHYKKIAARKAEMIEEENLNSDDDLNCKNESDGQDSSFTEEAYQENLILDDLDAKNHARKMLASGAVEQDTNSISVVCNTIVDGPKEEDANSTLVEECKEGLRTYWEANDINEGGEAVSVKGENVQNGPQNMVEHSEKVELETKSASERDVEMVEQPVKVEIKTSILERKVEMIEQPEEVEIETRKFKSKVEHVEQPEILITNTRSTSRSIVDLMEQREILEIKTTSALKSKVDFETKSTSGSKVENKKSTLESKVEIVEQPEILGRNTSERELEMIEQPEEVEIKTSTLESNGEVVVQPELLSTKTRNTSESEVDMVTQHEIREIKSPTASKSKVEHPEILKSKTRRTLGKKEGTIKSGGQIISQKSTPTKTERTLVGPTKKKPISPILKSPQNLTPGLSKPISSSTLMSASRSSAKKGGISSLSRSKNPSMSLSVDATEFNSAPPMITRRSLIMEKMGDKDIVKRAFKTFQNSLNQLNYSNDEKPCGPKQVGNYGPEKKVSEKVAAAMTSQKVNERTKKSAEMANTQRGQLGTKWNTTSTGSLRETFVDGRTMKPASSSMGLKTTNVKLEKGKEFLKKFEEKSYTKGTEKMRLSSKTKEEKEADIKKLRQSFNFKAKPMPEFYKGQGISNRALEKEGAKSEIGYR